MTKTIRFGGKRQKSTSHRENRSAFREDALATLLGKLSWKYVVEYPDFDRATVENSPKAKQEELRENIAHWIGRVWSHSNELPADDELRNFDILSLKDEYLQYVKKYGSKMLNEEGLTLEEIWASQQMYSRKPMSALVSYRHKDLLTKRIDPSRPMESQEIVWFLGALCFVHPDALGGQGFPILTTDGEIGHTVYIKGINGVDYTHPRGVAVRAGWFSFHDPWPARSLLAPIRSIQVIEDVTRPPMWLITPDDLEQVLVGTVLSVELLAHFLQIFAMLDSVKRLHQGSSKPLWLEEYSPDPKRPFASFLSLSQGIAPTTAESLIGLGRLRLLMGEVDDAVESFKGAVNLGYPRAATIAATLLESAGHKELAKQWFRRGGWWQQIWRR